MKTIFAVIGSLLWFAATAQLYIDPAQPLGVRVNDLLSRMTLKEKVAQLRSMYGAQPRLTDKVIDDPKVMDSLFHDGLGMMNPDFDATMEETIARRNALQHYLRTKTRLGIPTLFIDESHHGLLAPGADVFPTSISLACSWDTALVRSIYTIVAGEAYSRGTQLVLAPVVDVCRDPRWGRISETYGEDPFLCGIIGSAVVKGFQGSADGSISQGHVAATLKHFAGHGEPEGGVNQGPANYSERALRTFHMEPFRLCIENAKPAAVMAAYIELNDIPCHANHWLLTDVLRNEWHYKGMVVSDWWGIDQLWQKHGVAADVTEAAREAFTAGVTVDLPMGNNYRHLADLVNEHRILVKDIDSAVAKVLALKFRMGLFDQEQPVDVRRAQEEIGRPDRRSLTRKAAQESIVLLKNDDQLLPIKKDRYKTIAVIGPCGAVNYLGDYSGIPVQNASLLEGIRNKLKGTDTRVVFAKGCDITANGDTISYNNYQKAGMAVFPDASANDRLLKEAVGVAAGSDIIVLSIGENEQLVREAFAKDHLGDRATLDLLPQEEALAEAVIATGKPVVVCLTHGRPLSIGYIATHASAIVDGWYSGEEAGDALADILFGDVNPSGKLTISIPRSAGQLPIYYNRKPSAHFFDYVAEPGTPLYPFGYGLSYTHFRYANLQLSQPVMTADGKAQVSVEVTNTGEMAGDEIVQLYIHPKVSSVTQPIKELKGFYRIHLMPGETKKVSFAVTPEMLKIWDKDMHYRVEPGTYEVMVGGTSVEVQKIEVKVL